MTKEEITMICQCCNKQHKVKKEIGEVGWFMPSYTKSKLAEAASLKAAIEILEQHKNQNK